MFCTKKLYLHVLYKKNKLLGRHSVARYVYDYYRNDVILQRNYNVQTLYISRLRCPDAILRHIDLSRFSRSWRHFTVTACMYVFARIIANFLPVVIMNVNDTVQSIVIIYRLRILYLGFSLSAKSATRSTGTSAISSTTYAPSIRSGIRFAALRAANRISRRMTSSRDIDVTAKANMTCVCLKSRVNCSLLNYAVCMQMCFLCGLSKMQ